MILQTATQKNTGDLIHEFRHKTTILVNEQGRQRTWIDNANPTCSRTALYGVLTKPPGSLAQLGCTSSVKWSRKEIEMKYSMKKRNQYLTACMLTCLLAGMASAQESEKIANAMSAGPAAITAQATILDYPSDPAGDMIVLREGTNGWTCFTDWPATPGNDPMCVDQVFVEFLHALALGETPNVTRPGLAYMLQGGSEASYTDPFAMEPAPGEDWLVSPAHVMLIYPDSVDLSQFTTDPTRGEPYVMWAGTPYQHIMMPVVPSE